MRRVSSHWHNTWQGRCWIPNAELGFLSFDDFVQLKRFSQPQLKKKGITRNCFSFLEKYKQRKARWCVELMDSRKEKIQRWCWEALAPGNALSFLFLAEISEPLRMTDHDLGIWREERWDWCHEYILCLSYPCKAKSGSIVWGQFTRARRIAGDSWIACLTRSGLLFSLHLGFCVCYPSVWE